MTSASSRTGLPIAVFDSGVGGLTVLHECLVSLPEEDYVYLGDDARFPYGARSTEDLREHVEQVTRFLLERGAKLLTDNLETARKLNRTGFDAYLRGAFAEELSQVDLRQVDAEAPHDLGDIHLRHIDAERLQELTLIRCQKPLQRLGIDVLVDTLHVGALERGAERLALAAAQPLQLLHALHLQLQQPLMLRGTVRQPGHDRPGRTEGRR